MALIKKTNLPDVLVGEAIEFNRLKNLGTSRTTNGIENFTSSSSSIVYNSTTGEVGIYEKLNEKLQSYKINEDDWNDMVDEVEANKQTELKHNIDTNTRIDNLTQTVSDNKEDIEAKLKSHEVTNSYK